LICRRKSPALLISFFAVVRDHRCNFLNVQRLLLLVGYNHTWVQQRDIDSHFCLLTILHVSLCSGSERRSRQRTCPIMRLVWVPATRIRQPCRCERIATSCNSPASFSIAKFRQPRQHSSHIL